jgi:MoxR-like ATPase
MALGYGARAEGAVLEQVIDEVTASVSRRGLAA